MTDYEHMNWKKLKDQLQTLHYKVRHGMGDQETLHAKINTVNKKLAALGEGGVSDE